MELKINNMKKENNKNIFCSVSAGYSSVFMAIKIKEWYPDHNIIFAMANTSKENIESLHFMNECDKYFKLNLTWIEAKINQEKGKGTDLKIVNFEDLKTKGELFIDGIKKYGIPCKINKWCNRELKLAPLKKYADSVFGLNNYSIAVGIRADEIDRIGVNYKNNNTFYPLMLNKFTTTDRNRFWSKQPIKLNIPAYKGNCDLCFEKSFRKLMTIIVENPEYSIWWDIAEDIYGKIAIDGKDSYNAYAENGGMNFFRQNISMKQIIKMSKKPFSKATDEYIYENELFDSEDDCGGGCTVF